MSDRNLALAALITTAIAAPLAGLVYLWRRPLPIINGRLRLPGLRASVEIIRDRWGIPHIYAQDDADLFFAQGFVHAQDRLWQMELNRRIPTGRLSEIIGEVTFGIDQMMRIIGLGRAVENDWTHASEKAQSILNAYTRGVNAFLETHPNKLPLEFTLLRFAPEPWRPQDTMAWAKMMSWGQGLNWDSELVRAAILDKLDPERTAQLLGEDLSATNPIILHQSPIARAERLIFELRQAQTWLNITAPIGMSNNWVVDGTKSVTGKPLLASDPHLPLQIPSLWYEMHLITPEWQATGVSLPSAPGIIIGHNADIAWGVTNAFVDVQDLYIEKFHPGDPSLYEFQGQWEKANVVREEIRVKGEAQPRSLDVTITRHGPIMNAWSPLLSDPNAPKLALKWVGYEPSRLADGAYQINRARNWDEFTTALRDWTEPALSFVYADRAGNIGYYLAGCAPIRKNGKGAIPVPGWTGEYEWTGYIPFEELPHAFNPPQHYVATANNQVVGAEYPHHLTLDTMNGFRARRIIDLLNEKEKLSVDDYARIQADVYCAPAQTFVQLTSAFRDALVNHPALHARSAAARRALDTLNAWDGNLTATSTAGALYEVTLHFAMQRLFRPWLGALTDAFIGVGFHPLLHPVNGGSIDRAYLIALRILQNEEREWIRDADGNALTRVDILASALDDALNYLQAALGHDMQKWQWGKLHRAAFKHALGALKPFGRILNRGPFPYGGDTSTVWQAAFVPTLPIPDAALFTASWRQIMDVGDWDASRGIHAPGQSGHPASRHYADTMPLWFRGKHHPLWWTREKILANKEGILILE